MFDRLRIGDYVRWSKHLKENWFRLRYADDWLHEPDCPMEIIALVNTNDEAGLEMDCVNCCGCHTVLSLDRDEYDNNSMILGGDMLEIVTMSDITEALSPTIGGYNFDNEEDSILEMLSSGALS